jgi:hypothetical protein
MTIPERQTVAVAAGASQADALRAIARRLASDASANHGPVKASTLAAQLGLPRPEVDAALAELVRRGIALPVAGDDPRAPKVLFWICGKLRARLRLRAAEATEQERPG